MAAALALGAASREPDAGCVEAAKRPDWPKALELCGAAVDGGSRGIEALHAANAAFFLARPEEASEYLKKVAPGVDDGGVAQCEGRILEKRGDVSGSRKKFSEALALHEAVRDDPGAASDAALLARSYLYAGEFEKASGAVQTQLRHADASGDPRRSAYARMLLGDVLHEMGRADKAAEAYRASRSFYASADDYEMAAALDMREARLWLDSGNFALARVAYERARWAAEQAGSFPLRRKIALRLALIGTSQQRTDVAGWELGRTAELLAEQDSLADRVLLHTQLAEMALELRDPGSALAALASAPPHPPPDVAWWFPFIRGRAAILAGKKGEAEQHFEAAVLQLEDLRRGIPSRELKAWFLEGRRAPFEELFVLQVQRGDLAAAARTMDRAQAQPFLDAVASAGGSVVPPERVVQLLPPGEVVLAYFEALGRLWLIRMERGASRAFEISPPLPELRSRVDHFLEAPDDAAAAASVGEALLPGGALQPGDAIVRIVPSEILARVPFPGLRREGRRLVESHAFAYAPSLSALVMSAKPAAAGRPIILLDPLGDLPGARAEGIEIAALLGVEPFVGDRATSDVLARAKDAAVLHIGSHAGMGADGGWLDLAGKRVSAAEILSMGLHPRLAVLSSCASGASRGHSMWGGLATAFLAAGTPAVLATLRSVDDASTRELIVRFYREGGVDDPVRVLAKVQRELAAQRPASQWMFFVVLGQAVPVNGGKSNGKEGSPVGAANP